jgi:hypothetical protein
LSSRSSASARAISDAKDWWKSLVVDIKSHPLKALAIKLFSIVPHAAEVERFFSNLGGIQLVKRSNLTIPHMQTLGMLRNHYTQQLHDVAVAAGKPTRRKHAHMHTPLEGGGLDVSRAQTLLNDKNWTPEHETSQIGGSRGEGVEAVSPEEIDDEFNKLSEQVTSPADGDRLPSTVPIDQVYDLSTLDDIRAGKVTAIVVDDELELGSQAQNVDSWDPASLLRSLGV